MKFSIRKPMHSLSGRLVLLYIVMSLLFVAVLAFSIRSAFRHNFEDNVRPHLVRYLEYIHQDIGIPPDLEKAQALANDLPVEIYITGPDGNWSSDGTTLDLSHIRYFRNLYTGGVRIAWGHDDEREFLVSRSAGYTVAFVLQHPRRWYRGGLTPIISAVLILMLLYYLTRRLIAPIQTIRKGVETIGAGDLDHRLAIRRRDELGTLSQSINAMADDIQHMLEAKRQLLLAISHELRSPLTRAKVAVEFIENPQQRAEVNRDLNEMEQLIAELLETERLSTRHSALNKSTTRLDHLVAEVQQQLLNGERIRLDLPETEISAQVDVPRLKLLLKNLLVNALRHSPDTGESPRVILQTNRETALISVQDFGPGIDPEHLPHLTEPFYRVDSSRHRETGGYGLGLYLCRVIAEAHGGTLHIDSTPGTGTTVTVTLPLK